MEIFMYFGVIVITITSKAYTLCIQMYESFRNIGSTVDKVEVCSNLNLNTKLELKKEPQ